MTTLANICRDANFIGTLVILKQFSPEGMRFSRDSRCSRSKKFGVLFWTLQILWTAHFNRPHCLLTTPFTDLKWPSLSSLNSQLLQFHFFYGFGQFCTNAIVLWSGSSSVSFYGRIVVISCLFYIKWVLLRVIYKVFVIFGINFLSSLKTSSKPIRINSNTST